MLFCRGDTGTDSANRTPVPCGMSGDLRSDPSPVAGSFREASEGGLVERLAKTDIPQHREPLAGTPSFVFRDFFF